MKRLILFVVVLSCFCFGAYCPAQNRDPVTYHVSFDDFSFLEDCFVARSKAMTPEERKIEILDGRFGKALYLGFMPIIADDLNLTVMDLDLVTSVIYNIAMAKLKEGDFGDEGAADTEPFIWGAGKLHPASGAVAFWCKAPLRADMLFEQSANSCDVKS